MEQRVYRGNARPNDLADYLVQHYEQQRHIQVQKLGQGDTVMVQIGAGRHPDRVRGALTIGIAPLPDSSGVVITMGQQQWLGPDFGRTVTGSLIGAMFTPWALFSLIWPLSDMASSMSLPQDIWNTIDMYCTSAGATLAGSQQMGGVPCAYCGMMNPAGATTCATCGHALTPPPPPPQGGILTATQSEQAPQPATGPTTRLEGAVCPSCGTPVAAGARFCSNCGAQLV
jgi:hypothetical protein